MGPLVTWTEAMSSSWAPQPLKSGFKTTVPLNDFWPVRQVKIEQISCKRTWIVRRQDRGKARDKELEILKAPLPLESSWARDEIKVAEPCFVCSRNLWQCMTSIWHSQKVGCLLPWSSLYGGMSVRVMLRFKKTNDPWWCSLKGSCNL